MIQAAFPHARFIYLFYKAGLFLATVTAFLIESYKKLQSDSGDVSTQILLRISQQLDIQHSGDNASLPLAPLPALTSFQPTQRTIRVNIFWFISLGLSLATALAATMVQQWIREYKEAIERHSSPLKRAPIRAFLYKGIDRWKMGAVVEWIPGLLHLSLFFFMGGLVDFLGGISHAVRWAPLFLLAICAIVYLAITILPTFLTSPFPYQTPFSGMSWWLIYKVHRFVRFILHSRRKPVLTSLTERWEYFATKGPRAGRDLEAIRWITKQLTGEDKLMPLLEGIPGFLHSVPSRHLWAELIQGPSRTEDASQISHDSQYHQRPIAVEPICGKIEDPSLNPDLPYNASGDVKPSHDIGVRITRLLKSCVDPIFDEQMRRARAIACMDCVRALLPVPGLHWESYFGKDILNALADLNSLKDDGVAVRLICTNAMLLSKIIREPLFKDAAGDAADKIDKLVFDGDQALTEAWRASNKLSIVLKGLDDALDNLEEVFEESATADAEESVAAAWGAAKEALAEEISHLQSAQVKLQEITSPVQVALSDLHKAADDFQPLRQLERIFIEMEYFPRSERLLLSQNKRNIPVRILLALGQLRLVDQEPTPDLGWLRRQNQWITIPFSHVFGATLVNEHFSLLTHDVLLALILGDLVDNLRGSDHWKPLPGLQEELKTSRKHRQEHFQQYSQLPPIVFYRALLWSLQDVHNGGTAFAVQCLLSELRSSPLIMNEELLLDTLHGITCDFEPQTAHIGTQRLFCRILWTVIRDLDSDKFPISLIAFLIRIVGNTVRDQACISYLYDLLVDYSNFPRPERIEVLFRGWRGSSRSTWTIEAANTLIEIVESDRRTRQKL